MARPTPPKGKDPPKKRTRMGVLDYVIVILGIVFIIGYNRLGIARLQRSLPNANTQIVGEWRSTRGPEHLVFLADKSVSLISMPSPAQGNVAPPAPQAEGQTPAAQESGAAEPVSPAPAAPVVGKYQLSEAGKVFIELSNGKKCTTTIAPGNKNRFDLIDSFTEGVTTYERVP